MISVLLITHSEVGAALVNAATTTLGELPLPTTVVTIDYDTDPELLLPKLQKLIKQISRDDGVLVLTDLYGSTPNNIARRLQSGGHIEVVSGLNLSMLIRLMNYPNLTLAELATKALTGGKDGIIHCGCQ